MSPAKTKRSKKQGFIKQSLTPSFEGGWLHRDSDKRILAVEQVYAQGGEALDRMPQVTIFAPPINHAGHALRIPTNCMVYLSPTLEFEQQWKVNFTVAHEFAHVVLGHHRAGNRQMKIKADRHADRPAEKAADDLAESWGFRKPGPRAKDGLDQMLEIWRTIKNRKKG